MKSIRHKDLSMEIGKIGAREKFDEMGGIQAWDIERRDVGRGEMDMGREMYT